MGCEFSDKVREAKRQIVFEQYLKLDGKDRESFCRIYKHPDVMNENETWGAYYHCKRVLKKQKRG